MTANLVVDAALAERDLHALSRALVKLDISIRTTAVGNVATISRDDGDLTIFVGDAREGPMASTREDVMSARDSGVRFDAIILVGEVDDEEQLELVEIEFRELLSSQDFEGDALPLAHIRTQDLDTRRLDRLLRDARAFHNKTADAFLGPEDWRLLYLVTGSDSRLSALAEAAAANNRDFEREVRLALPRVLRYWSRAASVAWLSLPNRYLLGAAPIDAIALEGAAKVVDALEHEVWGGYV